MREEQQERKHSAVPRQKRDFYTRIFKTKNDENADSALKHYLLFLFTSVIGFVFLEITFHFFAYGELGNRIYMPIIFGVLSGCLFSSVLILFPGKVRFWCGAAVYLVITVFFISQLVYFHIFGAHLSLSQFGMGTDAVTSFWRETIAAMGDIWYQILILCLPMLGYIVLYLVKRFPKMRFSCKKIIMGFGITLVAYVLSLGLLYAGGTTPYSPYDLYHSSSVSTDLSVRGLGVLTTARLELKYMVFGGDSDLSEVLTDEGETVLSDTEVYNMIDIDFATLSESETNAEVGSLHDYFASASATKKNDYTGYFQGYNLIEFCCESFSPEFIDKELTPMLYEMYHNGFIFDNFYSPWESNTTNGEYTLCMGIFPDNSRSKSDGSFKASADHYVPFCLGNMFLSVGASSYGYHNYEGYYYCRNYTYPNMGLECKFAGDGMDFTNSWPASDLEMIQQSVGDYINEPQFFVHYMTFSGHYRYERNLNGIVELNWDQVSDLDYSDKVKSYISCNLELEYALQELVAQLESAGIADRTVIALTTDHFPYGLTIEEYSELAGREVDEDFGKYKNAFILWTPSMEENVVVEDPMCTVDILPTLLNLWGFPYDSRLLTGKDIFSDSPHVAILSNGSFITDKIMYNSKTGEVLCLPGTESVSDSYIESWVEEVKLRFTVSTAILNYDYYSYIAPYLDVYDVNVDTGDINSFNNTSRDPNAGMNRGGGNWTPVPPEDY